MGGVCIVNINEAKMKAFVDARRLRNDENELQRVPLVAERELFQCIKEGRYRDVKIHTFSQLRENMGALAPTDLMHYQFTAVAIVSVMCRVVIDSGVSPDDSFDLADAFLYKFAEAVSLEDVHQLLNLAAVMFAKQVYEIKSREAPYHVRQACLYISRNLFQKITLKEIAEFVQLSPNYLCSLFSAHMHMSIHEYIQKEKVKAACNFLSQSERPITEISTYLGFKSAANFSVIFRKWIGMSPSEYRSREFKDVY